MKSLVESDWKQVFMLQITSRLVIFDPMIPSSPFGDRNAVHLWVPPCEVCISILEREFRAYEAGGEPYLSAIRLSASQQMEPALTYLNAQGLGDGTFIGLADYAVLGRHWSEYGPVEIYLPGSSYKEIRHKRDAVLRKSGFQVAERVRPSGIDAAGEPESAVLEPFESVLFARAHVALREREPALQDLPIPVRHYDADSLMQRLYQKPFAFYSEEERVWGAVNMAPVWGAMFESWSGLGPGRNQILIRAMEQAS